MADHSYLRGVFEQVYRDLHSKLDAWAAQSISQEHGHDVDQTCRDWSSN